MPVERGPHVRLDCGCGCDDEMAAQCHEGGFEDSKKEHHSRGDPYGCTRPAGCKGIVDQYPEHLGDRECHDARAERTEESEQEPRENGLHMRVQAAERFPERGLLRHAISSSDRWLLVSLSNHPRAGEPKRRLPLRPLVNGGRPCQERLRGVRVRSTASGLQANRTGAKRDVPIPAETFSGTWRAPSSHGVRPRARQVGRSQLLTSAP